MKKKAKKLDPVKGLKRKLSLYREQHSWLTKRLYEEKAAKAYAVRVLREILSNLVPK